MKEQLIFDPTQVKDEQDNVGAHLFDSDGNGLTSTDAGGGVRALDVNLAASTGSIQVTATDLDIRDLSASQDNVAISDGTDTLAINADGSINVNSTPQGPIRFRDNTSAVVDVEEDTAPLPVKLQGATGDINITAGDLNVQLEHTGANFDSIRVGDGTNLLGMLSTGDAKVVDRSNASWLVTAATVGTSAALLVASALSGRRFVKIQNREKKPIEISHNSGLTLGDGYVIPGGATVELALGPALSIYAIGGAASMDVRVIESA